MTEPKNIDEAWVAIIKMNPRKVRCDSWPDSEVWCEYYETKKELERNIEKFSNEGEQDEE